MNFFAWRPLWNNEKFLNCCEAPKNAKKKKDLLDDLLDSEMQE